MLSVWCSVIYKLTCFTQFLRRPFYLYSPWCVHLQVPLHTGDLTCLSLCIALRCLIINTYRAILIVIHVWAITGVIDWSATEKLRNHFSTSNILLMLEVEVSAALSTREIFTSSWCVHQRLFHVKHCKYTSYSTFNWKIMLRCLPMSQVNTRVDRWWYVT